MKNVKSRTIVDVVVEAVRQYGLFSIQNHNILLSKKQNIKLPLYKISKVSAP